MLPVEVLERAQREMLDCGGSGQSVMEMSHRSKEYQAIIDEAESLLREIMNIPSNYKVLFLQGGASTQFAMIPLNLGTKNKKADFVTTGQWSKKAKSEAARYIEANEVASSADATFNYIPELDRSMFSPDADYVHITYNNTIYGTRYTSVPDTGNSVLVADMSSMILSEVVDVSRFGLIYAGAQKNMGPAGVTVVIIRDDLIGHAADITPTMLNYATHAENGSMYNTPPTYGIYICKLVYEWIKNMGGIAEIQKVNEAKAKILYDFLDSSKLFRGTVVPKDRSLMNVPFVTGDDELNAKFIAEAKSAGLVNLKGHRTVGGMRASIYNAMPVEGVKALVDLMEKFEKENGIRVRYMMTKDFAEAMQLVANKRADAFVLDDVLLAGQIANLKNAADFKILDAALSVEPYGAMFRKDDPQFKALVDKTVTNMIKSGELEKLYKTWFESPIPPKNVNLNFKMNNYTKELFANPSDKGI